jgi:hypothetical protein
MKKTEKEYQREYYLKNKQKIAERKKRKYEEGREEREILAKIKKEEKEKARKEKRKEYNRTWAREYRRKNKEYALRQNIKTHVWYALRKQASSKRGESVFQFLPYTVKQLKEHLEKQFDENMSWENYGSYWHVDHIHPQSAYPYTSMEEENFLRCWALENLRPLEAMENYQKSNKV